MILNSIHNVRLRFCVLPSIVLLCAFVHFRLCRLCFVEPINGNWTWRNNKETNGKNLITTTITNRNKNMIEFHFNNRYDILLFVHVKTSTGSKKLFCCCVIFSWFRSFFLGEFFSFSNFCLWHKRKQTNICVIFFSTTHDFECGMLSWCDDSLSKNSCMFYLLVLRFCLCFSS